MPPKWTFYLLFSPTEDTRINFHSLEFCHCVETAMGDADGIVEEKNMHEGVDPIFNDNDCKRPRCPLIDTNGWYMAFISYWLLPLAVPYVGQVSEGLVSMASNPSFIKVVHLVIGRRRYHWDYAEALYIVSMLLSRGWGLMDKPLPYGSIGHILWLADRYPWHDILAHGHGSWMLYYFCHVDYTFWLPKTFTNCNHGNCYLIIEEPFQYRHAVSSGLFMLLVGLQRIDPYRSLWPVSIQFPVYFLNPWPYAVCMTHYNGFSH